MKKNGAKVLLGVVVAFLLGGNGTESSALAQGAPDDEGPKRSLAFALAREAREVVEIEEDAKVSLPTVLSSTAAKLSTTPSVSDSAGPCGEGMVEVEGDYCTQVDQKCLRWLDPETKLRCAEFDTATTCVGKVVHKHFCMDRYEWPNKPGENPAIMKTWFQARDACQGVGKRLCGDSEWTLACEGQERLPYPYGYARNSEACNIDKPHPPVNEAAIANPATRDAEVARLWQGEPSGAREACVSAFGIHDMTGNVDEWVVNESGHPFKSGLKGGYWGPVRTRCRPMTTAHNEDFSFYQIGFRCCAETSSEVTGPRLHARPSETTPSKSASTAGS